MDPNSETESEPSSLPPLPTSPICYDAITSQTTNTDRVVSLELVKREIEKLSKPNLLSLLRRLSSQNSTSHLLELQQSINTLISFISELHESLLEDKTYDKVLSFANIVSDNFLDRLFAYRLYIRRTASGCSESVLRTTMVVTCIDELLVKVHESLPNIICCTNVLASDAGNLSTIQLQKQYDLRLAAIQLPETWHDVHVVIGSSKFSPAAKRLATSLLFATHIVHPQLCHRSLRQVGPLHIDIQNSLNFSVENLSSCFHSSTLLVDTVPRRTMAAMTIVLCSVVPGGISRGKRRLALRPEASRHLLHLIKSIMDRENQSYLPIEQLDVPQAILLQWGHVLPWIWSTWDDPRVAYTEYLPVVTASWLYHLDGALSDENITAMIALNVKTSIRAISELFLTVVKDLVHVTLPERALLAQITSKLFAIINHYFEMHTLNADPTIQSYIPEFTKSMITAYTSLAMSGNDAGIKDLCIECLALVPSGLLAASVHTLLEPGTNFTSCLEKGLSAFDLVIRNCIRSITLFTQEDNDVLVIERTKSLVELMSLILSSAEGPDKITVAQHALPLISSLFKFMKSQENTSLAFCALKSPLLMIVGTHRFTLSEQSFSKDIWTLIPPGGCHGIVTAGSLSKYIMTTGRLCSSLFVYEAWNFLVSSLIRILGRDVLEDDEPLALLSITGICCGVQELIHASKPFDRVRMLSSPWTSTLRNLLRELLRSELEDLYFQKLAKRINLIGEKVLKLISMNNQEIAALKGDTGIAYISRIIYYRDSRYAGIVHMCDLE